MTTTNLTGRLAITVADMLGLTLNKYADPTDPDATRAAGISVEVAREIAKQDPSLLWLDGEQVAAVIDDDAIRALRDEAMRAGDYEQAALCIAAIGDRLDQNGMTPTQVAALRASSRVACARVIAEARARR